MIDPSWKYKTGNTWQVMTTKWQFTEQNKPDRKEAPATMDWRQLMGTYSNRLPYADGQVNIR